LELAVHVMQESPVEFQSLTIKLNNELAITPCFANYTLTKLNSTESTEKENLAFKAFI
jgi:hypothetical protein